MYMFSIKSVAVMIVTSRWRKDHGEASAEEESVEEKSGSGSDDSDSDDNGVINSYSILKKSYQYAGLPEGQA